MKKQNSFQLAGHHILPGENKDLFLPISETYTGDQIRMPVNVIHSGNDGPVIFVTAAIHGDEINGTGIIHDFLFSENLKLRTLGQILFKMLNRRKLEAISRIRLHLFLSKFDHPTQSYDLFAKLRKIKLGESGFSVRSILNYARNSKS